MNNILKKIKHIPKRLDREIESMKYKKGMFADKLKILNSEESLAYIEEHSISFYRYGDGELAIMMGEGIAFQEADSRLAQRLLEMLTVQELGIMAAIPHCYFHYDQGMTKVLEGFNCAMKRQRRFFLKYCSPTQVYLDTTITQIYQSYECYDFEQYFDRVKRLFCGRRVTLICGRGIFKNIKYNLLEQCEELEYMDAPSKNAFSEYDGILAQALTIPKDRLVCIVLGPTAKPLTYDLYRQGYQVWDLGHFLKDYDAYCKKTAKDSDSITAFYRPD